MSGKFKVPIQLVDETNENGTITVSATDDHLILKTTEGEEHTVLDDRTALGSLASQDADSVAITGGNITGITPLAVTDGGTGATTAAGALANLGAVPTSRTVNGKALSSNVTLGPSDVGALASTTSYGASLEADGEDISLIDQNGTTLATVQTQDISGKLDKQAVYSSLGVTSTFFHEEDGGGYRLADTNDDSISFIGGNADTDSPIKVETYAKTVADNIGTRIIQTLEKVYYTAGKSSATYGNGDEVAVKSDIPTALSSLTNDGNYVTDASYVHTDNNFTTGEKTKLAGLDDNHFKGSYPSLTALETAHPTASDGDYAYVGVEGTPAVMYLWDVTDDEWVLGGSPAGETPASVKEKYESNEDTNAYTDDEKAIVGTVGDVADLTTTNKDTIVDAVNEVVGSLDGYVPTTRTVNSKSLSSNITLSNTDIGSEPAITAGTSSQFWRGDKSWQDFGDSVRATLLTGLSTSTKSAIVATDTAIVAFGKLQAQISSSMANPMTTAGDIIVGGQNGSPTRLALGSAGQVITSNGTSLLWADNSLYSLPLAIGDGGTGASTAAGALTNLGAVPTSRTVNGKALSSNVTLGPSDVGALPNTTSYGASLEADGEDISLIDQNGNTMATVQTQDITGKLDKQAIYSSAGVTSTFFHEEDGGGYRLTDTNDNSMSFIGGNADTDSPIKLETYAKTVADNIGTRIIQTLEKIYYTAGKSSATYGNGDEVAVKSNIPTALSQLANDGNYVVDASYVHTDNNFTTGEKSKLAGLDDNHFKGSYPSLTALETAHPTASDGDYAYVGTEGTPAVMYIWDVTDDEWVLGGSPAGETPASVKEKYESNADTNAYTDDDKDIVGTVGDVADLETTNKDTIVDAVNEVVDTFAGYVPSTRTVNGKSLSSNISLSNTDIGSEPAITAGTTAQFWQGNKSWQNFGDSVRATLLTGLSTSTKSAIAATDTAIVALGKLQAQVTASVSNPMTAVGDIIVGGTNGIPTRLPVGASGQVITSNGTSLAWADNSPYSLPIATTTTLGGIKPDGTSITVNASTGVASAVGGGGGSDSWVPSSQYIDITYGASADTYTAPADGWMYVECKTFNTNAYIIGRVIIDPEATVGIYGAGATTYSTNKDLYVLFPVGANYAFKMFNSNLDVNVFRFIYSKGAL